MKKTFFVIIILIFIFISIRIILPIPSQTTEKIPVPSPTISQTETANKFIVYQNIKYNYGIIDTTNKNVNLISNLEKKISGQKILDQDCRELVNAGFYDTNNNHLGLFEIGGKTIQKRQANNFLNGFIVSEKIGNYLISREYDESEEVNFVLQSGPILYEDSIPLKLAIKDDEPARRVVAILSTNHNLYFMTVYTLDNYYSGPLLSNLPEILKEVFINEKLNVNTALNLDGGSASLFYSSNIKLPEMTTVGGFFCINYK